jgi:hypothetical protein
MKNLFKVLFAAIILVVVNSGAFAQDASGNLSASATVNVLVTVTQEATLAFGNINLSSTKTVAPLAGGAVTITKSTGTDVTITITESDLSFNSNTLTLKDLTYDVTESFATKPSGSGTLYTDAFGASKSDASSFALFIGGTIQTTETQVAGSYAGDITVAVAYN